MRVVLPAPRKPVMIVFGMGAGLEGGGSVWVMVGRWLGGSVFGVVVFVVGGVIGAGERRVGREGPKSKVESREGRSRGD